jgi:hypothetical protein
MAHILVDTRMPDGDHIETRELDRRLEHDQSLVVLAHQPGWNECIALRDASLLPRVDPGGATRAARRVSFIMSISP